MSYMPPDANYLKLNSISYFKRCGVAGART